MGNRQEWATPPEFMNALGRTFDLDVCASPNNAKALSTTEDNGLASPWDGYCWCNPGFRDIQRWMDKAVRERTAITYLLTHAGHAKWAQFGWEHAAYCYLIYPRINFVPPEGIQPSSNDRDSMLWIFDPWVSHPCIIQPWRWTHDRLTLGGRPQPHQSVQATLSR